MSTITSMSPTEIVAATEAMLTDHGLLVERRWRVKVSARMTTTYGCCDYHKREIRISGPLAAINTAAQTLDTIAHEVAHAIAGPGSGHGPAWKAACALTGARPVACYSGDVVAVSQRWVGTCRACGEQVATRKQRPQGGKHHVARACTVPTADRLQRTIEWTDTHSTPAPKPAEPVAAKQPEVYVTCPGSYRPGEWGNGKGERDRCMECGKSDKVRTDGTLARHQPKK